MHGTASFLKRGGSVFAVRGYFGIFAAFLSITYNE
nr:MAG TPA: hypothetical protein [Caudoviricetes sp.]